MNESMNEWALSHTEIFVSIMKVIPFIPNIIWVFWFDSSQSVWVKSRCLSKHFHYTHHSIQILQTQLWGLFMISGKQKKKKKNCFLSVDKITMHKTLCKKQVSNTLWKVKSLHTWASVSFIRKSGILQESLNNSVEQTSSVPVGFISNCWWTNRK